MKKGITNTILVCFDYSHGDIPVLIIGRKNPEKGIENINAFQGDDATELYSNLVNRKDNKNA